MILKGSQRGGAGQLAQHLLREDENDHVHVQELRGFLASDLTGALAEAHAVSRGTKCKQFLFSMSINPPKDQSAGLEDILDAVDRAEQQLGLEGQPRAIVVHEKAGRRHAHVVWSRIDAKEMKARNLPFFKNQLSELSKVLYLEHGWELPRGHRENDWKNPLNFTLGEWQQAKRIGLDPREVKQLFQDAWAQSDNLPSFRHAIEDRGYFLAAGDRRGFVAVDVNGEVFSVSRMVGVKTKELTAKLGEPDHLPGVEAVKASIRERMQGQLDEHLAKSKNDQAQALAPLLDERTRMVAMQRQEREHLRALQDARLRVENQARAERITKGILGVWEVLTGRTAQIRRDNDREAFAGYQRDLAQREALFQAQIREREALQRRIDKMRAVQRLDRMRLQGRIAELLSNRGVGRPDRGPRAKRRPRGLSL